MYSYRSKHEDVYIKFINMEENIVSWDEWECLKNEAISIYSKKDFGVYSMTREWDIEVAQGNYFSRRLTLFPSKKLYPCPLCESETIDNENEFDYIERKCVICEYIFEPFYRPLRALENNHGVIVYVYSKKPSCGRKEHFIRTIRLGIPFGIEKTKKVVNAFFCTECNYYFIGKLTLEKLQEQYGVISVPIDKDERQSNVIRNSKGYQKLCDSKLKLLGYNVKEYGPDEPTRQKILVAIIKNGHLQLSEIISHIEWCINVFYNREQYSAAVSKWKNDLDFLNFLYDASVDFYEAINPISFISSKRRSQS